MFRARRRRWARTAGVEQRESPWALQVGAVGGQVRPSGAAAAPLRPRFLVQRDQEAPRSSPWALFRARRRRWARAAGRGAAREPPLALQVGPSQARCAPWRGCCSSLTPVLGAAALGVAWGSFLGFVPRTAASLG